MNYNNNKIFSELTDCILEMTTDDDVSYHEICAFEHLYCVVRQWWSSWEPSRNPAYGMTSFDQKLIGGPLSQFHLQKSQGTTPFQNVGFNQNFFAQFGRFEVA